MDSSAHKLLAETSIRRLMALRRGRHSQDARKAIRQWLRDLRWLRSRHLLRGVNDLAGRIT